jgi:hypothetical protein
MDAAVLTEIDQLHRSAGHRLYGVLETDAGHGEDGPVVIAGRCGRPGRWTTGDQRWHR